MDTLKVMLSGNGPIQGKRSRWKQLDAAMMLLVRTCFEPLMTGAGTATVQTFALRFILPSSTPPASLVHKEKLRWVPAALGRFKLGVGGTSLQKDCVGDRIIHISSRH